MNDGLGTPQHVVLLGGTSDIGLAIVRRLLSPAARTVVLGCRNTAAGEAAAAELRKVAPAVTVEVVEFDASDVATHEPLLASIADELVALEAGSQIAAGAPAQVLSDPLVVASYLGQDRSVVHRSGSGAPPGATSGEESA